MKNSLLSKDAIGSIDIKIKEGMEGGHIVLEFFEPTTEFKLLWIDPEGTPKDKMHGPTRYNKRYSPVIETT